jgi:N6-adenosine-specific RNA methylase IME4
MPDLGQSVASPEHTLVRYRTLVVDPPWPYPEGWPTSPARIPKGAIFDGRRTPMKYDQMTVEDIAALPIGEWADSNAHLWLWTTNRYLRQSFDIAQGWGFKFSQLLIWAKTPMGKGPGGAFAQSAEFVLFCRRGSLPYGEKQDSVWFNWPRTAKHSKKPDAMLDLVERVSPEPRAEFFARRARFGWDYPVGDQALGGVAA